MDFPAGETVTVLRATQVTDPYSGESSALDWSDPVEIPVPAPCGVAPTESSEPVTTWRTGQATGITVFVPAGTDVRPTDRVRIETGYYVGLWEVNCMPSDWTSPLTGWRPGMQVSLTRFGG